MRHQSLEVKMSFKNRRMSVKRRTREHKENERKEKINEGHKETKRELEGKIKRDTIRQKENEGEK